MARFDDYAQAHQTIRMERRQGILRDDISGLRPFPQWHGAGRWHAHCLSAPPWAESRLWPGP
jgi:hypothetical protein